MPTIRTCHSPDDADAGTIRIDNNGNVLEAHVAESMDEIPSRFDVNEFIQRYNKLDDCIDILDIGYWMADGTYEPPDEDWRFNVAVDKCGLNTYENILKLCSNLPMTWYGGLIRHITQCAYNKNVFLPGGAAVLVSDLGPQTTAPAPQPESQNPTCPDSQKHTNG